MLWRVPMLLYKLQDFFETGNQALIPRRPRGSPLGLDRDAERLQQLFVVEFIHWLIQPHSVAGTPRLPPSAFPMRPAM